MIRNLFLWLWSLDTRLVEWLMGVELMRRGTLWATGIAPMDAPFYEPMTKVTYAIVWGYMFIVVGIIQNAGVIINGNWRRSPALRMGALFFSVIAYTLLAQVFFNAGVGGAGIQGATRQAFNAMVCLWCFLNISAKRHAL